MATPLTHSDGLTTRAAKRALTQSFQEADLPFAEMEALEIVLHVTGLDRAALILRGSEPLTPAMCEQIQNAMTRRLAREPLDHILGWREFFGRRFTVTKDVLSPRADTETLIRLALSALSNIQNPHLLDLGTGSGAIGLTLLAERADATLIATDLSEAALNIARQNAKQLQVEDRVTFTQGAWWSAIAADTQFDAILSNPPYIDAKAMTALEIEVAEYDPALALAGGEDGLRDYRAILEQAHGHLRPQGWLGLEIGFDQANTVSTLVKMAGFIDINVTQDLGWNDRVVSARKSS